MADGDDVKRTPSARKEHREQTFPEEPDFFGYKGNKSARRAAALFPERERSAFSSCEAARVATSSSSRDRTSGSVPSTTAPEDRGASAENQGIRALPGPSRPWIATSGRDSLSRSAPSTLDFHTCSIVWLSRRQDFADSPGRFGELSGRGEWTATGPGTRQTPASGRAFIRAWTRTKPADSSFPSSTAER